MFPNIKRTTLSDHINVFKDGKLAVLKMAAIYGANGAGKSNLLKGANFLKALASDKDFLNEDNVCRYFFALKEDACSQPMELAVEFLTAGGEAYIYAVEIDSTGILSESLSLSGLGIEADRNVFVRERANVRYASDTAPSPEVQGIIAHWIQMNPFASLLTINDDVPILTDSNIADAQDWFKNELLIIGLHSFNPALIRLYKTMDDVRAFASDLFREIDLGIDSVKVETENFDDWIVSHKSSGVPVDKVAEMQTGGVLSEVVDFRNTRDISIEQGERKISQMMFEQFGKSGFSKDMDIQAQSDGTVRLLSLIPALYGAIKNGVTVLVDELDHSIHPQLVRNLVRYFSREKTNGQLIFSTHQTCLLNQDFIRTDEVWLVEKKEGNSYMYSLNDFKIHNTISIENGYMEGRYGAIPLVGSINI